LVPFILLLLLLLLLLLRPQLGEDRCMALTCEIA
jgi:hypothetical protein